MSLRDTLSGVLDTALEVVVDRLETGVEALEELLDTYLPDENVVSLQDKGRALADHYESEGHDPKVVAAYRDGQMPAPAVHFFYGLLTHVHPDKAVKGEKVPESPKTPEEYLAFLEKTNPVMARVYQQTLRNQKSDPFNRYDGYSNDIS